MKNQTAVIGNFDLVIECIKILKEQGFNIACLFSQTPSVLGWAKNQNISLAKDLNSFLNQIAEGNIDYLFSIQNPFIIPENILKSVNKLAINYHNTLLPKYVGTKNNACWIIWLDEKENGITWHTMSSLVDGGDILKQERFSLDKDETAFSLELKCQEYAKQALKELAAELQLGTVNMRAQDLNKRSIFYSFSRPCGFAIIDWNDTAESIGRQFRALHFGSQPNPITTLKFKYKERYFVVLEMNILEHETSGASPGTVVNINNESLQIATQSCDILMGYKSLDINASAFKILKGEMLENDNFSLVNQQHIAEQVARDELYWRKVCSYFVPGKNFIQNKTMNFYSYSQLFKIKLSELLPEPLKYTLENVLTVLLGYLYRVNNYENFSLCVSGKTVHIPDKSLSELFLKIKPFNVNFDHNVSFTEAKKITKNLLSDNENKNVLFKDLLLRYPDFEEALRRNAVLLNISPTTSIQNSIYPIIFDVDEADQTLSMRIANSFLDNSPFFLNFMQTHLNNLVKTWVTPDTPLNKVNFLSLAELQYLQAWNNTDVDFPDTKSITAIIDHTCKQFPDHIALETKERKISYQELKVYSDQIAKNILYYFPDKKMGNNLIGVFLDKSENTILTFLGILKAGLTYVVLDLSYPDDYLENVIRSTQAQVFIGQSSRYSRFSNIIKNIEKYDTSIYLDLDKTLLKENNELKLPTKIPTTTLAYVLFTSGSTGKPKGVMISQRSVINLINAVNTSIGTTYKDKLLQFSTLAFDTSVWEIYASFFAGGTLYVPDPSEILLGKNLQITIISKNISLCIFPPSVLKAQPYFESDTLKTIVVGGEECSPTLPKQWGKYYRFINVYGPTETTVIATMSEELKPNDEITIGRPLQNYQITISDRYQTELPIGAIGEIMISGIGVAKGYINSAELTQEKFKSVWVLDKEKTGYLSGDLGMWTKKGQIQYMGRTDSQLKIRGFRIETAFIEKTIHSYHGIGACIVLPEKTTKNEIFLNAFIMLENTPIKPSLKNLKNFLSRKLPQFMMPKKFFLIAYLPLTASGKIDYGQLANYSYPGLEELYEAVITPPKTKLQKEIVLLWKEIINFSHDVDINKEFSMLGGTSLQITQMILEIEKRYKVQISTADFLTRPTIKHLADIILNKEKYSYENDFKQIILDSLASCNQFMGFAHSNLEPLASKIKKVFLTGVSGFLGSYIARDFLKHDVELFCLVREHFPYHNLKTMLSTYGWRDTEIQKLNILEGDITKEQFGLNPHLYESLAREIDAICNSAAFVHHLFNYNQLKAPNVYGVWQCLKFAGSTKLKYFAHISTLSILNGVKNWMKNEHFLDINDLSFASLNGYNATKLDAEVCITEMLKEAAIQTKIYRAGLIGGDSFTGTFAYQKNHFFLLLKGCLQLGLAPDWNTSINIMPVDYAAKYIVSDILNLDKKNGVYNMVTPQSIFFKDFIRYFANLTKTKISFIPFEAWQVELKKSTEESALYQLMPLYLNKEDDSMLNMYDLISNVEHSLFSNNYSQLRLPAIPNINRLLSTYCNFFLKKGFFHEGN